MAINIKQLQVNTRVSTGDKILKDLYMAQFLTHLSVLTNAKKKVLFISELLANKIKNRRKAQQRPEHTYRNSNK